MLMIYRQRVKEWLDTKGIYYVTSAMDTVIERAFAGNIPAEQCANEIYAKFKVKAA